MSTTAALITEQRGTETQEVCESTDKLRAAAVQMEHQTQRTASIIMIRSETARDAASQERTGVRHREAVGDE